MDIQSVCGIMIVLSAINLLISLTVWRDLEVWFKDKVADPNTFTVPKNVDRLSITVGAGGGAGGGKMADKFKPVGLIKMMKPKKRRRRK